MRIEADADSVKDVDIWIAGAIAAFTVDLIVYPLDTIKTRLQSPNYEKRFANGNGTGPSRALFRGVYQGVGSVIVATLPSSGAFFTTYEGMKWVFDRQIPTSNGKQLIPTPILHAVASGMAELVSCAILTPAEVIKQNAQMVDNSNANRPRTNATIETIKCFRSNPLALWRGYTALAGRNLPFTALQFPIFERIRQRITQYRDERGLSTNTIAESGLITATSAGIGGSIAAIVTTPVDVVKTRIMLAAADNSAEDQKRVRGKIETAKGALVDAKDKRRQSIKKQLKDTGKHVMKPPSGRSSIQIARKIIREQGLKGLFRGGALRGVWTLLGSGLYLGVYESGRIYLARRRGEHLTRGDLE